MIRYILVQWPHRYPGDWRVVTTDAKSHKLQIYADYEDGEMKPNRHYISSTRSSTKDPDKLVEIQVQYMLSFPDIQASIISREEAIARML